MNLSTLSAISPLEGRYADKVNALRPIMSEYGLMKHRLMVEIRWLQWLASHPEITEAPAISEKANNLLNDMIAHFSEDDALTIKNIESTTNHDVKAIEYFIKAAVASQPELATLSEFIHFGCTSEDINNLAYGLMLQKTRDTILHPTLTNLITTLRTLAHQYAATPMLARTHGQPATPTTVGKEIANTIARLERQHQQLMASPILGKLNGATGNYNAFHTAYPNIDWRAVSEAFVTSLGLTWNAYTTQIEPHDYMAEFFAILMRINTILIDFNRDMWNYIAIQYFNQKAVSHEVGSSTMPHKINPIDFENAEGNLGIANALLDHMALKLPISRWQRDLTDSTVLRNIGVAMAHSILGYQSTSKGLGKVEVNLAITQHDLNQHWEVLAEAIQTVMRRYGIEQPYEKLKAFTRGQPITPPLLHKFISELTLPDDAKRDMLKLCPEEYTGYAPLLAKEI